MLIDYRTLFDKYSHMIYEYDVELKGKDKRKYEKLCQWYNTSLEIKVLKHQMEDLI